MYGNTLYCMLAGGIAALREGPSLIFLHLLGLDSQSHAHGGPHAQQYLDNIELVDRSTALLVEKIEALFPDEATAYLVTSDHGCTLFLHAPSMCSCL
jgi:predicted AlkP superfamily pyrophosphatase or phosphodiesterase